jgi:hypothetical protein
MGEVHCLLLLPVESVTAGLDLLALAHLQGLTAPGDPQQHPNIHNIYVEQETKYRYSVSCSRVLSFLPQWLPHRLQGYINSFRD